MDADQIVVLIMAASSNAARTPSCWCATEPMPSLESGFRKRKNARSKPSVTALQREFHGNQDGLRSFLYPAYNRDQADWYFNPQATIGVWY